MDAPLLPALPGYDNPELIAHGTTALVFRATQTRLNRLVAIKVITAETGSVPVNAARELATTVALSSQPHIVSIIDTGMTEDDRPYIVMEYCEGGSYAQILRHRGPLPVDDAVEVGVKIGEALHAAHQVGIVHRDVKPSNILRSRFGPALTDFGIARAPDELGGTLTREMMTPHHASPEALLHQAQSGLSDVYSLASTVWALLVGHPPFVDPSRPALDLYAFRDRVLHDPVPAIVREDVPLWLVTELTRAMAKLPSQRHASALDFADSLRRGALGLPPAPTPAPTAPLPSGTMPSAVPSGTMPSGPVPVPGLPAMAWPAAESGLLGMPPVAEPATPAVEPATPASAPQPSTPPPSALQPSAPHARTPPVHHVPASAPHPAQRSEHPPPVGPGLPPPEALGGGPGTVTPGQSATPQPVGDPPERPAPREPEYLTFPDPPDAAAASVDEGGWRGELTDVSREPTPTGPRITDVDVLRPAPSRRSLVATTLLMGAILVSVIAGAILVVGGRGRDRPEDHATAGASAGPTQVVTASVEGAPLDVRLTDRGTAITIKWRDPSGGRVPFGVVTRRADGTYLDPVQVPKNETTVTITGLDRKARYCFIVVAIYSVARSAAAPETCTEPTRTQVPSPSI